ncbi:LysR family transcriptional regulator [Marinomonas sp. 15G1-11]|uniref:LysR family transcriptional regulator n=1 Tax=Marinomonas phaeophyticola TaxID=3004091 RepID=A0ABT4JWZ9_9GAMM|nr:LysR family transcriptional regulator [Marinomonas sp. 15G1-11]MCZ2722887.1 LysR family transcriptional regulator [Marinomonas sp. 15G1-11]
MLNNQHLNTFNTLVECKSFTLAAKELNLTQPAVTQHIQKLERELERLLVVRQGKSIEMTPEGEQLYGYIQKVMKEYRLFRKSWDELPSNDGRVDAA